MNKELKQMMFDIDKSANGEISVIASKEIIDSDRDLVMIGGMDLKRFKANPVMLFSHNKNEPPIGKWTNIRKTKDKDGTPILTMSPEFSQSENHKLARIVEDLVTEGIMKTVSISFRPDYQKIKFVDAIGKKKAHQVIEESELHECSWVSIPSNEEAMVKAMDEGKISKEDMNYLKELDNSKDTNDTIDKDTVIVDLQSKIAALELLVKEQELEEEDGVYSELFEAFGITDGETVPETMDELMDDIL